MDPVAQIFEQAKNVSGGEPFGEFFVRGVESAQRDRDLDQRDVGLDINREQNRIANISAGLRATEGRAKQFLKLAEQEKDLEFTQAYTAWIAKDAPPEDIPNLMGLVNGTSANHEVVGQFFNRVKGIRDIADAAAERDAIRKENKDNFPSAEDQAAQLKFIRDNGMEPSFNAATGFFSGRTPSGESFEVTTDKDGTTTFRKLSGSAAGNGQAPDGSNSAGTQGRFQETLNSQQALRSQISVVRKLAIPDNLGFRGKAKSFFINTLLAPLQEALGQEADLDVGVKALENNLAMLRVKLMKALKPDSNMSVPELEELKAAFPDNGITDTAAGIRLTLDNLDSLNNAAEYIIRRNAPGISLEPLFERLLQSPGGQRKSVRMIRSMFQAGLMTKDEARGAMEMSGFTIDPTLPDLTLPSTLPNLPFSPGLPIGVEGSVFQGPPNPI